MRVSLSLLLLAGTGCGYMSRRGEDFLDVWKLEGHFSALPGAWVQAGPVVHTGLGWSGGWVSSRAGFRYNTLSPEGGRWVESGANVHGAGPTEAYYFFVHISYDSGASKHSCFALLPPLLNREGVHRNWIHDFDLEAAVVPFLGLSVGFSLGEFVDFLLGWFGIDLARDDTEDGRAARDYYADRAGLPRPDPPVRDASP